MDKQTLSSYGWIVVLVLVLSVMIAMATPFGEFIASGFKATYAGFGNVGSNVLDIMSQLPGSGGGGNGTEPEPTGIRFYQPYKGKHMNTAYELVFHEDGALDVYNLGGRQGQVYEPGYLSYEDEEITSNDSRFQFTISNNGKTLTGMIDGYIYILLSLTPVEIKPLRMNTNYTFLDVDTLMEWQFHEDGSGTYVQSYNGAEQWSRNYDTTTYTYYDTYLMHNEKNEWDGYYYLFRRAVHPSGARVIMNGKIIEIDCNHTNTKIENKTATYTGDKYCVDCGKLLEQGTSLYGLFEDGALEIFETQGIQAVQNMKIMPWEELMDGLMAVYRGNLHISILDDWSGDLIIPEDGSVIGIDDYAFKNCTGLTGIYIPNSITTIGTYAFYCENYASNLTTVLFQKDSNLTEIGHNAFCDCTKLESIYIPNGVTTLGHGSFRGSGISSVTFEENSSLDYIQYEAFCGCSNLTYIKIPASVRYMEDYDTTGVFTSSGLKTVEFEENSKLEYFARAFQNCASLETVNFGNNPNIKDISGMAFANDTKLTTVILPENIESLGRMAFSDSTSLTTIYLPSTVTSLGKSSLLHTNLTTIYFSGTMEQWNNISKTYASIPSGCTITCSDGTITI